MEGGERWPARVPGCQVHSQCQSGSLESSEQWGSEAVTRQLWSNCGTRHSNSLVRYCRKFRHYSLTRQGKQTIGNQKTTFRLFGTYPGMRMFGVFYQKLEPAIIFINLNNRPGLARLISEELIISTFSTRMG